MAAKKTPKPKKQGEGSVDPSVIPASSSQEDDSTLALNVDLKQSLFTSEDQQFLARIARFLVTVQSSRQFTLKARREGYTKEEHQEGWRLWLLATGQDQPFDHWLGEQTHFASLNSNEALDKLKRLDLFENYWFPRTRMIIRRLVPRDKRDAFEAAFFHDMAQQPLGPGVVGSVEKYIGRVRDLARSNNPYAAKVRAKLKERKLSDRVLDEASALVKELREGSKEGKPGIDPKAIAAAREAQVNALADLRDWFNDIATTLRDAFSLKERIQLGLTLVKRTSGGTQVAEEDEAESEETDGEEGDDEGEEAEVDEEADAEEAEPVKAQPVKAEAPKAEAAKLAKAKPAPAKKKKQTEPA